MGKLVLGMLLLGKLRILLHGEIGVGDVAVAEIKNFTAWGNWCWGCCCCGN